MAKYVVDDENLIKEWCYEENEKLGYFPDKLAVSSTARVFWKCQKCGDVWQARICNRNAGHGCRVCAGQKVKAGYNDLATTHPEVAKEWHPTANGDLKPENVMHGSTKKAYWLCKNGHTYYTRIDHRCCMKSECPYCSGSKPIENENDLATVYPELAKEWDYERNEKKPSEYLPYSNKEVYWICPICKNSYLKGISKRTIEHTGCTICPKEKGTSFPEQAICYYLSEVFEVRNRARGGKREIDIFLPNENFSFEYNGGYYHRNRKEKDEAKKQFFANDNIHIVSIEEGEENSCDVEGIQYLQTDVITVKTKDYRVSDSDLEWLIYKIFRVLGMYYGDIDIKRDRGQIYERYITERKENNFKTKFPEKAEEWDYEKNGKLKPECFSPLSNKTVFWKCKKCGHSFPAPINRRAISKSCPVCSGHVALKGLNDFGTKYPEIAKEWLKEKNGEITPYDVTPGSSSSKFWWKCSVCGHEWEAAVSTRVRHGCPACAGQTVIKGKNDLATLFPNVAKEWLQEKNGDVTPQDVTAGSNKKFWWKCSACGHEWATTVASRTSGCGCKMCAGKKRWETRRKNGKTKKQTV